jgi:hypothetical protein
LTVTRGCRLWWSMLPSGWSAWALSQKCRCARCSLPGSR